MNKKKIKDIEVMNAGANTYIIGYDTAAGKTGLVAVSQVRGTLPWFGRRWAKANSSPVGTAIGDLDLGQALAKQLGLGGYLVTNSHQRTKLSAENHNFLENGNPADLTGAAGHYQWGWNVPFYYQVYEDDNNLYETVSIGGPRKGLWNYYIPVGSRSCAGYCTEDRTNERLASVVNYTAQFRGGNNDATLDGTYKSQLCKPVTNQGIYYFRQKARENGTLWFVNERVMQYVTAALKRIIFGNRNIQAAFNASLDSNGLRQGGTGNGIDLVSNWNGNFSNYPYIKLDVGVDQGDYTGLLSTTIDVNGVSTTIGNIPSFYGLKNDYKYLCAMCEDMLVLNNSDKSQSLYVPDMVDGSMMNIYSVEGLTLIGRGPICSGWKYPKEYTLKNLSWWPKDDAGSGSTYYCDGYYSANTDSGLRGAQLLGSAHDGGHAGSLDLNCNYATSDSGADWGAFLCEWAEAFSALPVFVQDN